MPLPLRGEVEMSPCAHGPVDPAAWRVAVPFRTDDRGKLEVSAPAGCVDPTLRAGDLAPRTWTALTLEAAHLRPLGAQRLIAGAAVRVVGSGDGRPLDGVTVAAVESAAADRLVEEAGRGRGGAAALPGGSVVTGEQGWARLYGIPATEVTVLLLGPGLYQGTVWEKERKLEQVVVPRFRFERPEDEVEVRLPEGRMAGVVTDARGRPARGARVEARTARAGEAGDPSEDGFSSVHRVERTDQAGRFSFDALPSGTWTLQAEMDELESSPSTVDLLPDERIEDLQLVLDEEGVVAGRVVDSTGRAVAGVRLLITPRPGRIGEFAEPIHVETEAGGTFSVRSPLAGGQENVQVVGPNGTTSAVRSELGEDMLLRLPEPGAATRLSGSPRSVRALGSLGRGPRQRGSDHPCGYGGGLPESSPARHGGAASHHGRTSAAGAPVQQPASVDLGRLLPGR